MDNQARRKLREAIDAAHYLVTKLEELEAALPGQYSAEAAFDSHRQTVKHLAALLRESV